MRALLFLSLLFAASTGASPAASQPADTKQPFDRLVVGLRATGALDHGELHDSWEPALGGELDVATPFYAGDLFLLARFSTNGVREDASVPDMMSLGFLAGWNVSRRVAGPLRLGVGAGVGVVQWKFDVDEQESLRYESEVCTELNARATVELGGAWSLVAAAAWQRTYTYDPIHITDLAFGVAHTFGAPGWIRSVFE